MKSEYAYGIAVVALLVIGSFNPGMGLGGLVIAGIWAWRDCQ